MHIYGMRKLYANCPLHSPKETLTYCFCPKPFQRYLHMRRRTVGLVCHCTHTFEPLLLRLSLHLGCPCRIIRLPQN